MPVQPHKWIVPGQPRYGWCPTTTLSESFQLIVIDTAALRARVQTESWTIHRSPPPSARICRGQLRPPVWNGCPNRASVMKLCSAS